ncbi:multicomponent Na+:H+ antiporter subunit G [Desulfitispora alkaliphila]
MTEIIVSLFVLVGVFFVLAGTIGVLRLPDVYGRMHAATKSSTLGVASIMLGMLVFFSFQGNASMKTILGILFIFMTAPVGAHMISRAAYRTGVKQWEKSVEDDLKGECSINSKREQEC